MAKSQRQELVSTLRPQAIQALQDLINECDSGLTLQLQKFGEFLNHWSDLRSIANLSCSIFQREAIAW